MYVQVVALVESVGWFCFLGMVLFALGCYLKGR